MAKRLPEPPEFLIHARDRSQQAMSMAQRWAGDAAGEARRQTFRVRDMVDDLGSETGLPIDQHILLNGLRFHFRDWGNLPGSAQAGPPLLLLHGFTGNAHSWDGLARRLRRRYRVLALDQRGHGESDWADDYAVERFVEDLDAFVKALGLAPLTLVGMSMGGRNAFHYAGAHPMAVGRLILGDIGPEISAAGRERIAAATQLSDVFDDPEEAVQRVLAGNPRAQAAAARQRALSNLLRLDDGRWTFRFDRSLRDPETPLPRPSADEGWDQVAKINCPTLLIRGAESDVLSVETADRMVRVMQDCRVSELAASGHSLGVDQPEEFYAAIERFLAGG